MMSRFMISRCCCNVPVTQMLGGSSQPAFVGPGCVANLFPFTVGVRGGSVVKGLPNEDTATGGIPAGTTYTLVLTPIENQLATVGGTYSIDIFGVDSFPSECVVTRGAATTLVFTETEIEDGTELSIDVTTQWLATRVLSLAGTSLRRYLALIPNWSGGTNDYARFTYEMRVT